MKEMDKQLKKELVKIYEKFLTIGEEEIVRKQAKKIYNEYISAGTLISDNLMNHVARLFVLAYPNSGSGIKSLTKKEARKILNDLKNESN